jgi:lipopolysaccharide/colanic/teichoic acid biosynthesis glycosyltransferase
MIDEPSDITPLLNWRSPANHAGKRLFDIAGAIIAIVAFSPIMLIIALAIRASNTGPVVYRQDRVGAFHAEFTMFKFRTMRGSAAFEQATAHDPRVTAIGRFLRRSSLDELLQLFNVLRGEMSLVGPRPHAIETRVQGVAFAEALDGYQRRHMAKPGITGLAQIRGYRGETKTIDDLAQRLSSDLEYIDHWSIWLDLSILFRTIPVMFTQVNAY